MTEDDYAGLYAQLCDVVYRTTHPHMDFPDGLIHTSSASRAAATKIMAVLEEWMDFDEC